MKRLLVFVLLFTTLGAAAAQTTRPADPDASPKLLENDQIKVRELRMKAGTRIVAQSLPNTFLYALTDGSLVFTQPGRTPYELTFKAGEALWLPSQQAAMANDFGKDIRALLVEIKQRPAAARPKSKGKAGKPPKSKPRPAAKKK